ncbi:hypothetical protein [Streptomyces daliensis]|uniref:Uncharacterized protein n=1 Tax=Streptomyces daliensis TaxID=299421 RepID=A0A8T4ITE1_9ACTN|nr:hypothetical protein [Streptomyces daliensis]
MTEPEHECDVEDPVHDGAVREHVTARSSPYYRPLWLCARHRKYVGPALDRIAVTGEELVRAIAVLSGAGKRRTDDETTEADPEQDVEPEHAPTPPQTPPTLRVVNPS